MVPEPPPDRAQGLHRRRLDVVLSAGPPDAAQAPRVHPPLALVALCAADATREAADARDHRAAL